MGIRDDCRFEIARTMNRLKRSIAASDRKLAELHRQNQDATRKAEADLKAAGFSVVRLDDGFAIQRDHDGRVGSMRFPTYWHGRTFARSLGAT